MPDAPAPDSMTHHLCLVSAQVTPNLTPIIDPRTRPHTVVLALSAEMSERADWLERVIRPRGIRVLRWPVDHPYDIEQTQNQLLAQISEYPAHDQLVLNATGGTKPMSIAAYEIFRHLDLPIFYVHPERDRLIWMHPKGWSPIDLDDRLKLEDFLDAHGAQVDGSIQRSRIPPRHQELVRRLVGEIDRFAPGLGTLNWLASGAEGRLRSDPLSGLAYVDRNLFTTSPRNCGRSIRCRISGAASTSSAGNAAKPYPMKSTWRRSSTTACT